MWELDSKESWAWKNWCFWTVVLEKTLENPLDYKEIKPVNPKGNQSWIFIGSYSLGRTWPVAGNRRRLGFQGCSSEVPAGLACSVGCSKGEEHSVVLMSLSVHWAERLVTSILGVFMTPGSPLPTPTTSGLSLFPGNTVRWKRTSKSSPVHVSTLLGN